MRGICMLADKENEAGWRSEVLDCAIETFRQLVAENAGGYFVTTYLDPATHAALQSAAAQRSQTPQAIVQSALAQFLKR